MILTNDNVNQQVCYDNANFTNDEIINIFSIGFAIVLHKYIRDDFLVTDCFNNFFQRSSLISFYLFFNSLFFVN